MPGSCEPHSDLPSTREAATCSFAAERFGGGKRRAILVSATESDPDGLRSAGEFLLNRRRLNVALSHAKEKMILVASRSVFSVFNTDEEIFANTQIWKNLLRRTCTEQLWAGERHGHRVEVWGKSSTALLAA